MTTTIERGTAGLVYATDPDVAGVFIVARDTEEAARIAEQARRALAGEKVEVEKHYIEDWDMGRFKITVPYPGQMNRPQRQEMMSRFKAHLTARILPDLHAAREAYRAAQAEK